MAPRYVAWPLLPILALVLAALVPLPASAQLPPVLNPGDHYRFVGADVDVELGPGCGGVVNGCGVDYGDLGVDSPRMYVSSVVNVGLFGTTRTATGRLAHEFSLSPGPDHLITAKLIGVVKWRGWLEADLGALDNTSSSEIGVSIYDVTDGTRRLVANQTLHTSSVSGQISDLPIPNFIRDIGQGGFDLVVNLRRGHVYLCAVEATCTSTSGLVGLVTAASYSTYGRGRSVLSDGFVEQTSMSITLDPDYLALIDELRDDFEHHTHNYLTGRGVGHNNTVAVTSGPIDSAAIVIDAPGGGVGAPELSIVTAAPDRVELSAQLPRGSVSPIVERKTSDSEWSTVSAVPSSGAVVDGTVLPGARYGYRVRAVVGGAESLSDELWVDVPAHVSLGLEGARPNPIAGKLRVTFSLPTTSPATLTLYDVQGRALMTREVGPMGLGRHSVDWSSADPLANGIYLLRLTQAGQSVTTKVALMR
jgi:hypothetical protein